jgi:arsenate reductase
MAATPSVLFVCVHNAGRSQMAAGFLTHLTPDAVEASTVVITMGCGDSCPVFPGVSYRDWQLADPAGRGVEQVRPIRDEIRSRVEALIAELAPTD